MRRSISPLVLFYLAMGALPCLASAEPVGDASRTDPEALELMQNDGVFFSVGSIPDLTDASTFKAYLLAKDPYADFLAPDEHESFASSLREQYAGIGLELERTSGAVLCYPDPAGPAAQAGIRAGDRLVAIDGFPVHAQGLPTLVAMAAGSPGSLMVIDVVQKTGALKRFAIPRTLKVGASVSQRHFGSSDVIRIGSFTANTRHELEFAISREPPGEPLILDLRGNRGGDLSSAIDCATLFLNKGALIATVRGRHGSTPFVSSFGRPPYTQRIFLWQDGGTASAAEVFIAALTENGRADSVGRQSFGKGSRQELLTLKSGGVLVLTTGYLLTPTGAQIDGRGLVPGHIIATAGAPARAYLDAVKRSMPRSQQVQTCH